MFCQTLIMVAIVAIGAAAKAERPWFCQSYACPGFTPKDLGSYEMRSYGETNWVTTSTISSRPDPSWWEKRVMFKKLFRYISGQNANDQKIKMTVPVLTKVEKRRDDFKITMMFYLTSSNPPAPKSDDVFLVTRPAGPVFVRTFPSWWWPSNKKYRQKLSEMKKVIGDKSRYVDDVYYKAGYNAPFDWFKKKQFEVWMDSAQN